MARLVAALLLLTVACGGALAFSKLGEVRYDQLSPEAKQTLALILKGGPFPHAKDGTAFGNREGLLPKKPRGYYREYTVKTPGSRDRGARRIIGGGPGEFYYTDDHYRSFRKVLQ